MRPSDDLSRSLASFTYDATAIAVVELSQKTWLVGGIIPGINRHPEKKIAPDEQALLRLLHRWRDEAGKAGHAVSRIAVAFEAGRDGFWLARWLRARNIEAYVIHPTSIPVSLEHRRAKTDRLDLTVRRPLRTSDRTRMRCTSRSLIATQPTASLQLNREGGGHFYVAPGGHFNIAPTTIVA
jgi:transposase